MGNKERSLAQKCRKDVSDPENPSAGEVYFVVCADSWDKDASDKQQVSEQRHSKADMEHWDTVMRENLGEDRSYNKPSKLREEITTRQFFQKINDMRTSSPSETTSTKELGRENR